MRPPAGSRALRLSLLLALVLGGASTLHAPCALAWQPDGFPVCTNIYDQSFPKVVSDGAGGVFIAWEFSYTDPYVQHVTGSGEIAPGWYFDGVPVCTALGDQWISDLLSDGAGGVFLVWEDNRDVANNRYDVYAHHVLANGVLDSNWPVDGLAIAASLGFQRFPRLAPDGQGGVFIAWDDEQGGFVDVYMHHVSGSGTLAAGWPVGGKRVCTAPGQRGAAKLIADGTDGVFVVFADRRTASTTMIDVYAIRVTADGSPAPGWSATGTAVSATTGSQSLPELVSDGSGGLYVAWVDWRTAPPNDPTGDQYAHVYMQHMTGNGSLVPGWPADGLGVCTVAGGQRRMSLDADGSGGALVAWTDYRYVGPTGAYLARVLPTGALSPGWPANGLRLSTAGGLTTGVVADGTGGAYVSLGFGEQVWAQHMTGEGALAPGWSPQGIHLTLPPGGQSNASIASDGMGGAIVAWDDSRNGYNRDIFAQQLVPSVPTATLVSLVSTEAEPGRVRLTWFAADGASLVASLERRTTTSDWQLIASMSPDGSGQMRYEDRDVTSGTRYGYRLSYREGTEATLTPEVWVEVPALVFALKGLTPNPSLGDPVASFTLASERPATLEVFDIRGRRVESCEVGSLGPGAHTLRLGGSSRLAAGVYSVRLRSGAEIAIARAVVFR